MPVNETEGILFAQPTTFSEREEIAQACSLGLPVSIPMLVDEITDDANLAYGALPDRLFVIGGEGRVAFRGEPGPMGFEPGPWESAIVALLD